MSKRVNFKKIGIPVGAQLIFIKNHKIRAEVIPGNKIKIDNQIHSLSSGAKMILEKMGYRWKTVQGTKFWLYNNESIHWFLNDN